MHDFKYENALEVKLINFFDVNTYVGVFLIGFIVKLRAQQGRSEND